MPSLPQPGLAIHDLHFGSRTVVPNTTALSAQMTSSLRLKITPAMRRGVLASDAPSAWHRLRAVDGRPISDEAGVSTCPELDELPETDLRSAASKKSPLGRPAVMRRATSGEATRSSDDRGTCQPRQLLIRGSGRLSQDTDRTAEFLRYAKTAAHVGAKAPAATSRRVCWLISRRHSSIHRASGAIADLLSRRSSRGRQLAPRAWPAP